MAISDKVETTREDVISMVHCRHTYGHNNQISNHFFWSLLGEQLSDIEINEYAASVMRQNGCTQEDYDDAVENLTEWRDSQNG